MVPAVETMSRGRKPMLGAVRATGDLLEARLFTSARWGRLVEYLELTPRQSEIAQRICEGLTYKAIAQQTGISINTVRMHMRALFSKLGAHDRLSVVLRMIAADRLLRKQARQKDGEV